MLQCKDRMGNTCTAGGAKIECLCSNRKVTANCTDNRDGTYLLEWHSNDAGVYEVSVTIEGMVITGMPAPLRLVSGTPALSKTVVSGDGLGTANAGQSESIVIQLLDEHSNVAMAPPTFRFGMTLVRSGDKEEKDRWKSARSFDFQGEGRDGEFHISYCLQKAGDRDMTLWCFDKAASGPRVALPGSPFKVECVAGKPNAEGSFIDGFAKEEDRASR